MRRMTPEKIDNRRIGSMLKTIDAALAHTAPPVVTLIAMAEKDPFKVLVSTILSARTKDETTAAASYRLFEAAPDAESLAALPVAKIAKLVYPVGFYKTKAKNLRKTARALLDDWHGEVPSDIDSLVELPGVGRKTANLVLTEAFQIPAICVDTHVHRICNLWGYVATQDPKVTEMDLRAKLPKKYWLRLNAILVSFGQQTCVPVSPRCSECPVSHRCPRLGVVHSR